MNDIPNALLSISNYRRSILKGSSFDFKNDTCITLVLKDQILGTVELNLNSERYIIKEQRVSSFEVIRLGEVVEIVMGQAPPGSNCNMDNRGIPFVKVGNFGIIRPRIEEWTTNPLKIAQPNDSLVCVVGATIGKLNRGIDVGYR